MPKLLLLPGLQEGPSTCQSGTTLQNNTRKSSTSPPAGRSIHPSSSPSMQKTCLSQAECHKSFPVLNLPANGDALKFLEGKQGPYRPPTTVGQHGSSTKLAQILAKAFLWRVFLGTIEELYRPTINHSRCRMSCGWAAGFLLYPSSLIYYSLATLMAGSVLL